MKKGSINDLCDVIAGQSPKGSAYNKDQKGIEFHQGKIAFGDLFIQPSGVWTTEITKLAQPNDILMSVRAPVGPTNLTNRQICIGRGLAAIRCKDGVMPRYILYALKRIEKQIVGNDGAVFNSINKKQIEELPVLIADIAEQERIVALLDDQFAKIDALKANAASQLQAAKDLFQFALKEMLKPKEGWEKKTLGDIAKSTADGPFGSNLKAEHYTLERQVRIIQLSNIGDFCWRDENVKYTTFEHLKTIARSEVKPNEVVIAKMMPAGRAILCPNIETKYVLSSDAVRVELKEGYDPNFIQYYINSNHFNTQVIENVTGSGRVRTSLTKLRSYYLYIPNYIEQKQLAKDLDIIYAKIIALQANYDQTLTLCNDLKQALLKSIFE